MIRLSAAQQETLACLARIAGDEATWVPTSQVVAERLKTKGVAADGGRSAQGYKAGTESSLELLKGLVPQLVISNATSWRLTVAGVCVAGVQLGMFKKGGKVTAATKGVSAGPGRHGV